MTKEITKAEGKKLSPFQQVQEMLQNQKAAIAAVSAKHLDPERMISVALQAMATNPALLECVPITVASALATAGRLGLNPDPNLRQCALVPRKSKHFKYKGTTGHKVCYLWIQSGGWVQLAYRSNKIKSFEAHVVKEKDQFSYSLGTNPAIDHKITVPDKKRGEVTHAYAVAETTMGGKLFRVLDRDEIDQLREMSDGKDGVFWTKWLDEMAEAKVSKQLAKYLPVSTDDALAYAVGVDDVMDGAGVPASPLNVTPTNDEQLAHDILEKKTEQVTGAASEDSPVEHTLISVEQQTKIKDMAHQAGVPIETAVNAMTDIVLNAKDQVNLNGLDREEVYAMVQTQAATLYNAYKAKAAQKKANGKAKAATKEPPKDPGKKAAAPPTKKEPEPPVNRSEHPWLDALDADDDARQAAGDDDEPPPPPDDDDAPPEAYTGNTDDDLETLGGMFG